MLDQSERVSRPGQSRIILSSWTLLSDRVIQPSPTETARGYPYHDRRIIIIRVCGRQMAEKGRQEFAQSVHSHHRRRAESAGGGGTSHLFARGR